jgi:hypothetical protein
VKLRHIPLLFVPDLRRVLSHIEVALHDLEDLEVLTPDDVSRPVRELRAARRLLSHP